MINFKTDKEIETIKEGGKRLREVVTKLRPIIDVGVTTREIDKKAEELIRIVGAEPSFKRVEGYRWSTCVPINEQIVHTPPSSRVLKDGDIFTLDIGLYYQGFHTDYSDTWIVGKAKSKEEVKFLAVGAETLKKAIAVAVKDNHIGNISHVIEKEVRGAGYYPARELTGHGIGHELHEEPYIPGYLDHPIVKTPLLKPGLVIAIEVIYAKTTDKIAYEKGVEWSIVTADKSISACFEHTVAITGDKTIIIT